jgi:peptide/nickel transport system substrate-binding protein
MARRRIPTPLVLATLAAMALGAATTPAAAQTNPPGTLRIGIDNDADALDPTLSRTLVGRVVFNGLCDKLVDIDAKLAIVPQLATSFTWTDPLTLELKLRQGVKFHDGTELDSAAVKASLERHLNMQGSTRRGELAGLKDIVEVERHTVRLVLSAPNSSFLAQLTDRAGMIMSAKAIATLGNDFGKAPVCAGPFRFTERIPQDRIVLDRFPDYWDAANIHLNRLVYLPVVDGSVRVANLRAGALDMIMGLLPHNADEVKGDNRLRLVVMDGLGYTSLTFNHTNGTRPRTPMMQDARVRKAFELSLDRKALVDVVYGGLYTVMAQAVPPNSPFHAPQVAVPARDVAKARALLAEAGVKTPLAVELMIPNSPDARQAGEVMQSMASEAGFDVKLRSTEFVTALRASDAGDFEIFFIGWSGRADADANMWNMIRTKGPLNSSGYSNPTVDTWLEEARATTDIAARRALYGKIAAQVHQDIPLLYLFSGKPIMGMSARVSGFVPVPDGLIRVQGMRIAP